MSEYTASNGVKVDSQTQGITGRRRIVFDHGNHGNSIEMSAEEAVALIESLDHERDEDLGRWRYMDDPDWVVREIDRDGYGRRNVECLNERTFEKTSFNAIVATGESAKHRAARAFFEAHPERKPWHDAKNGEAWLLTHVKGETGVFLVYGDRFNSDAWGFPLDGESITAGRRIWPEGDAS